MVPPASGVSDRLHRRAIELTAYVARVEALAGRGALGVRDVDRAYGGAFIIFHSNVEESLEDLFYGLLGGKLRVRRSRIQPLVTFRSGAVARRVVRGDRSYVDWLPYNERLKTRAAAYFGPGDPFSGLAAPHVRPLTTATIVRNALAHDSDEAVLRFRRQLIDGRAIPPPEQRPARYLRGFHAVGVTRFVNLIAECVNTIRVVAS